MSLHEGSEVIPNADAPPAGDRKLGLALSVIATAQLMLILDGTIVGVALPSILDDLHFAPADLNWVMTAYALAFGGLLLVGGRAGDVFGRKKVFRIGLVVFTLASLLGGFATSDAMLIAARALQGVGAAITAPTALSLLATTFPPGPARNKAFGVYGMMGGLGSVVGLLLGGALTDYLNWRWVLFVNVPIAIGLLIGTGVLIEGERDRGKIDLPGAITATLGLGSLVFAINRTNVHGWGDGLTVACLIASAVLLTSFLLIQRGSAVAMMPPRVFRNRGRIGANVVMFLVGAGMFATFYFLTLYMQDVKGYTPMECGLAYLPFAVGIVVAAGGIGPQLLARMSERAVILLGLAIAAVGMAWFGMLTPDQNMFAALLPAQLVAGIGLGLTFVTVTIVAVRGVELRDTGIASGLVNTSQQIGGALGLAGLVAVALAVMNGAAPGTATPEVLTNGYTAGLMIAGGLYLVALVVGALTISGGAPNDAADAPVGGPAAR